MNKKPQHLLFFFGEALLMRGFNIKCLQMPRNAVTKHIFTIYIYICLPCFLDYTVSTTVCNLNSSCWDSLAQIEERSSSIVRYKLLRVKVHFSWTKLGFVDPYLRNLNFVCRSGMHAHRNSSCSKDGFSATCWSCSNLTEKGHHIWSGYWRGVLGDYLSVTSQLMVECRNDRAENALGLGWEKWANMTKLLPV